MINFIESSLLNDDCAKERGKLFVIRCEPDPFTGERINVGVGLIDSSGKRFIKVIHEPGRLECLYGDMASHVISMAKVAAECFLAGIQSPSTQIIFSEPMPFYEGSGEEVLNNAFREQVTVALPHRQESQKKTVDDDEAITRVVNHIKNLNGLQADVLANTPQVIIQTDRGPRAVMIPLQPKNGVGTIKSTDYSGQTLKSHLLDGLLDLEFAARYRNKDKLGMFLLRPKRGLEKAEKQIDQVIDSIAFRAPKNLYLEVQEDDLELAKAVNHWADAAA